MEVEWKDEKKTIRDIENNKKGSDWERENNIIISFMIRKSGK